MAAAVVGCLYALCVKSHCEMWTPDAVRLAAASAWLQLAVTYCAADSDAGR